LTESQLIDSVVSLPLLRRFTLPITQGGNAIPANEIRSAVSGHLSSAIIEVSTAHEWDFATAEHIHSGGTAANQAEYTLSGASNDARDILGIKYGSAETLLNKMSQADYDIYSWRRSITSVIIWIPYGRVNDFPRIQFKATPEVAAEQIKYRYRRKNISFQQFPEEFQWVLMANIVKRMIPESEPSYINALDQMKDEYSGGGVWEESVAPLDRGRTMLNNRRDRLYGYGGE